MSDLHHFARQLVDSLGAHAPATLATPLVLEDLIQRVLPYRAARRRLGILNVEDYEALLLRLVAGEGGLAEAMPAAAVERCRAELDTGHPDLGVLRELEGVTLRLNLGAIAVGALVEDEGPGAIVRHYTLAEPGEHPEPESQPPETPAPARSREPAPPEPGEPPPPALPDEPFIVKPDPAQEAPVSGPAAAPAHPKSAQHAPDLEPSTGAGTGPTPEPESVEPVPVEQEREAVPGEMASEPAPEPEKSLDPEDEPPAGPEQQAEAELLAPPVPMVPPPPAAHPEPPPRCPHCASRLPLGRPVRFCPHCGSNVVPLECTRCGAALEPAWRHCVLCGAPAVNDSRFA